MGRKISFLKRAGIHIDGWVYFLRHLTMLIIGIIKWKFRGKSFIAAIEASFDERKAIHNTEMAAIDEAIDRLKKKNSQLTAELAALSGKLKAGIYQVRFK